MLKVEHSINYLNKKKADSEILGEIQYVKQLNSQIRFKRSDDNPELPGNFKVGQAIGGGDCFFDSVAQELKRLKPEMDFTVKSLREVCKRFAQSQLENDQSWLEGALRNEAEPISVYVPRIEFTANDIEQKSESVNVLGLNSPIWGRSEIEGRIICKEYNVKLHIVEKHVVAGKEVWLDQIVNSEGSRSVDGVDYNEENTIHIINRGNAHFEPILSTQEVRYNRQQSSNHDTPKEELKIPTKEKPKKKSQESGQQSPDFSSDRVKRTNNDPKAGSSQQSSSDDNRIQDESWTSNQEHAAGELKRSLHGNDYQLKLLMLFASKGKNSEVAFRLATEMAEAEKFDDLVFRYTDSQGSIKYRFLQAKHRQCLGEENKIKVSDLKSNSDDNDFSLQKYFISYLKDIEKEEFRDGVPEDFIICTNTDFYFEPSTTKNEKQKTKDSKKTWKAYFSEKTGDDPALNLGGKRYQFNEDPSIRAKIILELKPIFQESLEKNKLSNDNVKKIDGFLDKLVFAVEQPSGASLEQKIKDTIGNEFNLINEIIYNDFFKFMHDWMKHRKKDPEEKGGGRAHFLTDKDIEQFLSEASKKIASLGLISSTLLCKREIEKFGLKFKDNIEAVKKILEFLSQEGSKERILIVCSKSGLLSKIKVFQMLENHDANSSIFSDLKSLSLLVGSSVDPVSAFSSKERNYLIIENLSTPDKDAKDLLSNFYQIVIKELNKKFILIIQPEQKDNIQKLFEDENYVKIIEDDDNKLKDLTSESQKKILETEITLFGKKRKLTSLTTDASKDDLYLAIDGDALTTLINGDSNVIGSEHKYDFDTYIDIPRTLTYQTKIDKKCLKENKNDLFAISGIEKSDFFQLVPKKEKIREFIEKDPNEKDHIRFIILDNHRDIKEDFDQLCRDHKKHNIHLLENKDSVLEWKQSHGSLFNLRRFILDTGSQTKKIKDLTNLAIIAGEAGMGKSTILTTYSMSKDFLWSIRINLKDYQTDIDKANFDDLSGIMKFLSNVIDPASSKTSLIKNLLQYCLKQQGQVTLLLDGYDEIKDHSQKKVELLLRTLKTTQGKVLITTRSYARSELEDALGIFAYSLNPFCEEEQKEFLKSFWIERLNVKEATQENKIDAFTKQLLNYFHELNLMKKENLVGIVLQARMVAEIFQDKCKEYLEHEQFNSYDFRISNISDLYEKFVEYQYERYLKEKIEISGKLSEGSRISLTRSYTKAYGNLALKSLFSEDQIQELLRKERFLGEELQDIGLVKTLKNHGTADFLHPTYAEYFVADFLVNALRKEKDHPKYRAVDNFLRMQIFRDHNKVIHDFIENKIKKESDSNLSSKWKAIQNCNLLEGVKTKVELQLLRPPDDALSGKSLTELLEEFKKNTPKGTYKGCEGYFYNYKGKDNKIDASLIDRVFDNFTKETNIKELQDALNYFMEIKNGGGIHLYFVDSILKRRLDGAIGYFLNEYKKQDKLEHQYLAKILQVKLPVFDEIKENFSRISGTHNADQYKNLLESLYSILEKKINLEDLPYLSLALEFDYKDFMDRIKLYIDSDESIQKKYTEKTINFLKGLSVGNGGLIDSALGDMTTCGFLQSFFTHIAHHANIIEYTKSSINEIYKDKGLAWLERQGVLISRVLEIITPEMSERFNSVLDGKIDGGTHIYSSGVFIDLINYIVNRVRVEELPQVDKLAFLKMLVHFVDFSVEANRKLPFTPEQLEATLKLVKDILNGQRQPTLAVSESIEYLFILGKAGLKLIDAKKELLVLDPAGEFQYKLSSGHMDQIIELIKWKNKNSSKPRKEFLKKCYEIVELKKGNLKRKGSESDLQELKRTKVEDCLLNRRKREAESECQFTWEDVDEFNEEKDEKRDFSKIKIDGERFVSYIKDLPEEKQSQLIQLADKVKITGESQSLVNKLIGNQKVISHLNRVGRISGMTMHGMMAKNVLADFLNGDYQGVAVNVGFIAGGQGFAKVAEAASLKGLKLAQEGKLLVGRSLRAASPFLARGTSAFVVYDLVNQIKAFKNGTEEVLVGVVGDSIYLGVDAAEIGVEVAEAFEVLEGVSSVTGPIGATIGAVVFVGTDVYMAVKRVDKIDQIIHLKGNERFIEGLRAFIGMQPERYIEELMEEKQLSNQLVKQGLEYLQQHSNIQRYVFPTGKSVVDSCRDVPYQKSICSGGFNWCSARRTVTCYTEKCTTKFEVDLDNTVLLERKRTDVKWSRAKPDNPDGGQVFCLPQGDYEPAPNYGSYLCESAIGVTDLSANKTGGYTLINLGEGKDNVKGFTDSRNIFVVNNGSKEYYGGNKDDIFVLQAGYVKGYLSGEGGINTLDTTSFAFQEEPLNIQLDIGEIVDYSRDNWLRVCDINKVIGRENRAETITVSCNGCNSNVKLIDGQSGNKEIKDKINIVDNHCSYQMQVIVRPNTVIYNRALEGNFDYLVPLNEGGSAEFIFIFGPERFNVNNTFWFGYEPVDIKSINVRYVNIFNRTEHEVKFNFIKSEKEFNVTIPYAENPSYRLGKNGEIKIGNKDNLYMLQSSNESSEEIIKNYLPLASRLNKMSFFIQSLLSNETVVIGSGNHEVIHNNPAYRSHLVGNGGKNVYVIDSESKRFEIPLPEVVIYDLDKESSVDTIDLRNLVQQARSKFSNKDSFELKVLESANDLLLKATVVEMEQTEDSSVSKIGKHEYFTVRLKDGVNWYNRTHVIVDRVPMRINLDNNEWSLKPQPLVFEKDKEVIIVTGQDVEKNTELIIPKKGGNYTFIRDHGTNLMITNAFDANITKEDLCTITLSKFYEEPKMETLSVKFADKEIVLKDHQEQINTARDMNIVKKEHSDQVYNDVFNSVKSEPEVIMVADQPMDHKHRHEHSRHRTRHRRSENITSSGARPSSWINDLFGWVKSSVSGLLGFRATLPEISENYSNKSGTSQFSSEVCISNNAGLGFFLLQSFLDKKYPLPKFCSVTPEEALANTLNIVEEFKKTLKKTAKQSDVLVKDVNFFKVYLDVAGHVRNERYSQIPHTLYSVAKEACLKNEKFLNILKGNIEKMFDEQEIINSKYQANDIVDNKPRSYLNNTTVDKQLQESYYAISS